MIRYDSILCASTNLCASAVHLFICSSASPSDGWRDGRLVHQRITLSQVGRRWLNGSSTWKNERIQNGYTDFYPMNHKWITNESWIHDFGWLWMAWWCFMCQMSSVRLSYGNWNAMFFYGGSFQRKLACGWCATSRCSISILVIPVAMQPALGLISLKYCRTVSNMVDLSDLNCNLRGSFWNLAWPAWNRSQARTWNDRHKQRSGLAKLLSVC